MASTFSPISIDRIYVHQEGAKLPKAGSNFFLTYFSAVQRVVKSGINIEDDSETLNIWVNRSTYYVSTLQKYADANFTPKTGIKVRFSLLPDESKLTYAYAAGTHPDMALGVGSGSPYDLGLRGALEDMTQFEGFNEVAANFAAGAFTNLTCPGDDKNGDGVITYAMMKGQEGNVEAEFRTQFGVEDANAVLTAAGKSALAYFDSNNTDCYQVDLDGAWSAKAAKEYMDTNLVTYNEANGNMIELVICNNDGMAEGVIVQQKAEGNNHSLQQQIQCQHKQP